jgi:hypothetical protein
MTEQELCDAVERNDVGFVLDAYRAAATRADTDVRSRLVTSLLSGAASTTAGHSAAHVAKRALEIANEVMKQLGEVP